MRDERQLMQFSTPQAVFLKNGVPAELCGAQSKGDLEPCRKLREECQRHCGSNLKTKPGERCPTPPMSNGRCRMHGGKSLVGVASPQFRHGRRSKFSSILTGTNLERYEDALNDPAHVELRAELALIETLLFDALERAQIGQLGPLWRKLSDKASSFRAAERSGQSARRTHLLSEMFEIIEDGAAAHLAMTEAADLIERKRKIAETERKRLTEEQHMISAARALTFASAVVAAVRRHVDDRDALAAISADLAALVHQDLSER